MAELQIARSEGAGQAETRTGSSFEQERRELLESVMGALTSAVADPDEMVACSYLLRHLAVIVGNRAA